MGLRATIKFINSLDFNKDPEGSRQRVNEYIHSHLRLCKFFGFNKTYELMREMGENAKSFSHVYAANKALETLLGPDGKFNIVGEENIPDSNSGPVIYAVHRHNWGGIDGLGLVGKLGGILEERSRNYKVIAISLVRYIEGMDGAFIYVDRRARSVKENYNGENIGPLRKILGHLDGGGDIAIYPSGETPYYPFWFFGARDPPWEETFGSLSMRAEYVVPLKFKGTGHGWQHRILSFPWPSLRRLAVLKEAWNKKGKTIELIIGKPILSKQELKQFGKDYKARTKYIKERCESL